ncbi:hypothetical protein HMSSN036_44240 [Paenibacillus macerans]|nr:hypothetical protein HMSSN036_44240 [Paenibacillus macerans]
MKSGADFEIELNKNTSFMNGIERSKRMKLRVSAIQYHLHTINSFAEFARQVEHYIKTAEEFGADFVLFPEFLRPS